MTAAITTSRWMRGTGRIMSLRRSPGKLVARPARCRNAPVLQIKLLGPLEVRDGERVVDIRRRKQRALLAVLALRSGEPVSPDRLVEDIWGDLPAQDGAARVGELRLRAEADPRA